MPKKSVVRLTKQARRVLRDLIRQRNGSSMKGRRAHLLLQADADGPNGTDQRIAAAFDGPTTTVQNVRPRLLTQGVEATLDQQPPPPPPRAKLVDGRPEAKGIAGRRGKPPRGHANGSLRRLAGPVVELGIAANVSQETLRTTLKKRG